MNTRRFLIAGNWKMNAGGDDGMDLATEVASGAGKAVDVDTVVAPPTTALAAVAFRLSQKRASVGVAGQNIHQRDTGAFTGEVSAQMIKVCGATWVIIGHSERRQLFGETDELVADKIKAANAAGLRPIVCVGETLDQREAGQTLEVVGAQVRSALPGLAESLDGVIAYEPIWAIGTGKTASPDDAQEVHAAIRKIVGEQAEEWADRVRLLYGGSVKPNNAEGLLTQADIDGALVGGASLKGESFSKIIEIAQRITDQQAEAAKEGVEDDGSEESSADDPAGDTTNGEADAEA